jgi:sec-independent protein translocase protein TatA
MFGMNTSELMIIFFIILLLFGGKKLPELARSMGSAIREYNMASREPSKYVASRTKTKEEEDRDSILITARQLGIETEGRSINEIAKDIVKTTENTTQ